MKNMMIILMWSIVLVAALALYFRQTYSKFAEYGVKHLRAVPIFGNMLSIFFQMEHPTAEMERAYKKFRNERFIGRYEFMNPIIVPQDIELIKKITIKDFEHFIDHRGVGDDGFISRILFFLKGEEWKDMRSTLSPAFTSSKIKLMVAFMEEVADQMIRAVKKNIKESDSGSVDVDVKDLSSRFTNDVIASCAFGLKVNSHGDENNKFYEMGKTATTFKFRQIMLVFLISTIPGLAKIIKLKLFSEESKNFFIDLVMGTMKDREARQIMRPDMIHLLMEAKKGRLSYDDKNEIKDTGFSTAEESSIGMKTVERVWSDNDLTAQALIFFMAGFETVSTMMSFVLFELAVNPEIQEKLLQEIREHNDKNGGKLNLNSIQNMTYMDMVISEVLRLWPPVSNLDRVCVKDYNIGKPNPEAPKDYIVKKGDVLSIPVWCFHRDPKLFPNPEKFDPERFSEENKQNINPVAYMPFGVGPRNCIGSRFALCEIKVFLYQTLLHLKVSPSEKTGIPPKLSTASFNPRLEGGHWLKFEMRS